MARTYGGWRKKTSIGLFGLGFGSTMFVLASVVVLMVVGTFAPSVAGYLLPVFAAAVAIMIIPIQGGSMAGFVSARARWWWARFRGQTRYRSGVMVEHPHAFQLPGVLAPVTLLSAEDGRGGRFGIAWNRRTGHMTATIQVVPNSVWLAESGEVDGWVANWHEWLAGLGHAPWVRWVAVTVQTAPDPGADLQHSVKSALAENSPEQARKIMTDLVVEAPSVSARVETRVSVTFDPRLFPTNPKDRLEAVTEVGTYLNSLESSLTGCGISVRGRATPQELVTMVRTAYDPDSSPMMQRSLMAEPEGIKTDDWSEATPVNAESFTDRYEHEGATSVSWVWQEAPRTVVHSDVLARVLAPTRWMKRTTLLFRPWPAASAAKVLEAQSSAAQYKSELSRRIRHQVSARDRQDESRALQAANEESQGSGLVQMSMYVTASVLDSEQVDRVAAQTESDAEASRIRLRRAWGSQDVAFAASLPLGVCPPYLLSRAKL